MNINCKKLIKEKQTNKNLKTKFWFREKYNFIFKRQNSTLNFLPCVESFKWCCKECGLIFSSEKLSKKHILGKKHQNIVFYNLNSLARINQKHKMSSLKQDLSKKIHNGNIKNLPFNKNLEHRSTLCDILPIKRRGNILTTINKSEKGNFSSTDLSIYRTPSGKYYCQSCNLSVNSQAQFLQHTESRKHKHKANKPAFKLK